MRLPTLLAALALCGPLLMTGCNRAGLQDQARIARLEAQVAALSAAQSPAPGAASMVVAGAGPELGQQMLELQIRHARLWQAGSARNWLLTQFQLAELRESIKGVIEANGEHAALQPERLADVMPAMMNPALSAMQSAVDARDGARLDAAFDGVSAACSACHAASDHAFLVIQRPRTPVLDNLRAEPTASAP